MSAADLEAAEAKRARKRDAWARACAVTEILPVLTERELTALGIVARAESLLDHGFVLTEPAVNRLLLARLIQVHRIRRLRKFDLFVTERGRAVLNHGTARVGALEGPGFRTITAADFEGKTLGGAT